jgi:tetratricopeptide (TPR) repeat protein
MSNQDKNYDITPEEFDRIERYLLNRMDVEEYEAFQSNILKNRKLQDQADTLRLILLGVQESLLKDKMEEFHLPLSATEERAKPSLAKIMPLKRWLVAAAIVLVVATGSWLIFFSGSDEKLFSEYYKPDPGLITAMSTSDNYLFDRAMIDYKTGNYDSAVKAWEGLLVNKPENDTLNYFLGSSYLALENNKKATAHLQKVLAINNSYFEKEASWYLGLCLLQQGKKKEAVEYIKRSDHAQKAALLQKLER